MISHMKNKGIAILLAIFTGGIGGHRFYLGESKKGLLMLLFFWTFIPVIIAIIDIFRLSFMSESKFQRRYS